MTTYDWEKNIQGDSRKVVLAGYGVIALMVATFGYWSVTAPLGGAAVATGTVAASGRNILIQHLEGGVVSKINVKEGDRVTAGEELMLVNDTAAKTQVNRLQKQLLTLYATAERLVLERDSADMLTFSGDLIAKSIKVKMPDVLDEQQKEFIARYDRFKSEEEILGQRIITLDESIKGLNGQKESILHQSVILDDDIDRKKKLLTQGLTNHFEYSAMQRSQADLIAQASTIESDLASTRSQIAEAKEQVARLKTQRVEQAVSQLTETRTNINDMEEQLLQAMAVLGRVSIKSPTDGIIISSLYNHEGSVIAPGEKLMEILPIGSDSIVEAKLGPNDIDSVKVGQPARLRLTALNARLTPEVEATVVSVSADRLVDPSTQQPYFRTRLKITDNLPSGVTKTQIYPGMPVEAFISTGDRTFMEYLARPMIDSFHRAFTEE